MMRRQGATIIVAITHLDFADDRKLVETVPGIDLVIGGHEHFAITATANRTLISKAGSMRASSIASTSMPARHRNGGALYELIPITKRDRRPTTAAVAL